MLTKLMWVPGLFWLFPLIVNTTNKQEEVFYLRRVCGWHVLYSIIQVAVVFWVGFFAIKG